VRDLVIRLSTQKTGLTTSSAMAGLIGPDVLSQFDLKVDYSRNRLILEENEHYGRRPAISSWVFALASNSAHFEAPQCGASLLDQIEASVRNRAAPWANSGIR
jgi:hypothetical protein